MMQRFSVIALLALTGAISWIIGARLDFALSAGSVILYTDPLS
jgi:hypothetical protein